MRYLIPALVALSFAAPALAQPVAPGDDLVASLPHPYDIEAAGDRLGAAVGAIVNVPIGNVLRSVDPRSSVDPRTTIADVAGRDDPDFQGRLQDQVAGMSTQAADMVRQIAVVAPALSRSLADLERNLDEALQGIPR